MNKPILIDQWVKTSDRLPHIDDCHYEIFIYLTKESCRKYCGQGEGTRLIAAKFYHLKKESIDIPYFYVFDTYQNKTIIFSLEEVTCWMYQPIIKIPEDYLCI